MRRMFTIEEIEDIGGGGSHAVLSVNGKTGHVNLTASDVGAIAEGTHDNTKQDKLTAGTNITIDENNVISASGGSGGTELFVATFDTTPVDIIGEAYRDGKVIKMAYPYEEMTDIYFDLAKYDGEVGSFTFAGVYNDLYYQFLVDEDGWADPYTSSTYTTGASTGGYWTSITLGPNTENLHQITGTSDGENWTSITIDGNTRTIPNSNRVYYCQGIETVDQLFSLLNDDYIILYDYFYDGVHTIFTLTDGNPVQATFTCAQDDQIIYFNVTQSGWGAKSYKYLENSANKITSMTQYSTDTQYPSAKCVYDAIQAAGWNYKIDLSRVVTQLPDSGPEGDVVFVLEA